MKIVLAIAAILIIVAAVRRSLVNRIYKDEEMVPDRRILLGAVRESAPFDKATAKPGTYDESAFVNPKTGKFRFPKYRSPQSAWVKVVDVSSYHEDLWSDLDPEEKREFSVKDFEYHFVSAEIEVETFGEALLKRQNPLLADYPFLKEHGSKLEELIYTFEDPGFNGASGDWVVADSDFDKELLSRGMLAEKVFPTPEEQAAYVTRYLESLKVEELKQICRSKGLKATGKKAELVNQLQDPAVQLNVPPAARKTQAFDDMLNRLRAAYVNDIRNSVDSWHPAIIAEVWELVSTDACDAGIESIVKELLKERYWQERLA